MKPEEIDRLFRDELEKLEHVPGIEWNDETAWSKISTSLQGGWSNLWTWSLSAVVVVVTAWIIVRMSVPHDTPVTQEKKVTPAVTVPAKIDSTNKIPEKRTVPVRKKRLSATARKQPAEKHEDTIAVAPIDTLSSQPQPVDTPEPGLKRRWPMNKFSLGDLPLRENQFTFSIPRLSYLKLKVNNGFNFSNLARSIQAEKEAGKNLYYIYEYNKAFAPPLFDKVHPRFMINNTSTYTNFNR